MRCHSRAGPLSRENAARSSDQPPAFFPDVKVLGALPPTQVARALRRIGDPDATDVRDRADASAESLESLGIVSRLFGLGGPRAWEYTTHQIGYGVDPAIPDS
jgi:hypothetical protein